MESVNVVELVPIPRVWERLSLVEQRLNEITESEDEFLTKIARHLIESGGKRLRPLLAAVAAELGPADDRRPVEAGTAVELIHVGSLCHDDVIDEASTRHGIDSVNATWGNTAAILAGDFLMARASEVAATSLGLDAVVILARTYAQLCEGQVLELELADELVQKPADYYRVIERKTASLIRTSARLGAMASDASPEVVEGVSTWAWEVGMVFQLTDDLLDLVASEEFLGKPVRSDIAEGKFTLAVLHALEGSAGDRMRSLLAGGHPYHADSVAEVAKLVHGSGAIERVFAEATERVRRAEVAAGTLPAGRARDVLMSLGRYLLQRVEAARATQG